MATDKIVDLANLQGELRRRRASAERPADGRPIIALAAGELRTRVADEAEAALRGSSERFYKQGGRVIRIAWDQIGLAGGGAGRALRLSEIAAPAALEAFERVARFERWDARIEDWAPANCPKETAEAWLARSGRWELPYLLGVVTAPILRPDGSALERPGYDPATCLAFDPAGVEFPPIPASPTREDALAARDALFAPLAKMPFVGPADRAVAISGIVTATIRRALPTAPLHAFTAPVAGSGKSNCVDVAAIIAPGERAAVVTSGRDRFGDAELEKRLTSSLLAGDAILSLDNLEGPLGGELICAALTQTRVKLRPLGRSINVDVPVTTTFFATSNNLTVVGDATRRVLAARLDPGVERPELLRFDFDPLELARDKRPQLAIAALTIIRAWLGSGAEPREPPLGSFAEWSRLVREPLMWLGEADPVEVMEEIRKGDPRLAKLRAIADAWASAFGAEPIKIADVLAAAQARWEEDRDAWRNPELRAALLAVTAGGEQAPINGEKLSWWLRKNLGRVVDGKKFERDEDRKRDRWRLAGAGSSSRPASAEEPPF